MKLGGGSLGDVLLALGLVQGLSDATGTNDGLCYRGPRPRLMQRCRLPLTTEHRHGPHTVGTVLDSGRTFVAAPGEPQAWLDVLDEEQVEVHAALPMRYYLIAEQTLGVRLPANRAPLPAFSSSEPVQPFHVVFVATTSWPSRKDYGVDRFAAIARILTERQSASWTFTLVVGEAPSAIPRADIEILAGLDAADCVDVFASAEVVIGNDTGLTHLAALTERSDGTGPHVIGLYGRHAHTKWTTGRRRHHAIAAPFSQMLSAADRCPVRDNLDDELWATTSSLGQMPAEMIADVAGQVAGWW